MYILRGVGYIIMLCGVWISNYNLLSLKLIFLIFYRFFKRGVISLDKISVRKDKRNRMLLLEIKFDVFCFFSG